MCCTLPPLKVVFFLTLVHDLDGGTLNLSRGGRGHVLELERLLVKIEFALPWIQVDLESQQQHRCTIENGQAQSHNRVLVLVVHLETVHFILR